MRQTIKEGRVVESHVFESQFLLPVKDERMISFHFGQLSEIPGLDLTNMDSKALCELLLYGSPQLTIIDNRKILEATMSFIERSMRLD